VSLGLLLALGPLATLWLLDNFSSSQGARNFGMIVGMSAFVLTPLGALIFLVGLMRSIFSRD
jgi:hypothetical protein